MIEIAFSWGPDHIWLHTTLEGLWSHYLILEVCWDILWTLSFGLSHFHGHSYWLVCEVAPSVWFTPWTMKLDHGGWPFPCSDFRGPVSSKSIYKVFCPLTRYKSNLGWDTRRKLVHFNLGHRDSYSRKCINKSIWLAPGRYPWCTQGRCLPGCQTKLICLCIFWVRVAMA